MGFWLKSFERPPAGVIKRFFGLKYEIEVISETDGDVVRSSERGCALIKRMGPGLVNLLNWCEMGSLAV